jgi:6-phosphofructokinase 1
MKLEGKVLVAQGGGPTAVINQSLVGAVLESRKFPQITKVYGANNGVHGIVNEDFIDLTQETTHNLEQVAITPSSALFSTRDKPDEAYCREIFNVLRAHDIRYFFYIGGNDSADTVRIVNEQAELSDYEFRAIHIPKTIDNDVFGTDITFGFDSAVSIATDAIDRLHSTANSHQRAMVIEVMGHHAGWIALYAGMAGGGDIILIPEIKYKVDNVCQSIVERFSKGKTSAIVVVAEGIEKPDNINAAAYLVDKIQKNTGIEARETRLGYIQRGGSPSSSDRILATRYGAFAAELIARGEYGKMVTVRGGVLDTIDLKEVGNKLRLVDPQDSLIIKARNMGVLFGDEKNFS